MERHGRYDKEARVVKIGVLIIGSLYWDDEPPRPDWRAERLDCMHQEHVKGLCQVNRIHSKISVDYRWLI